MDSEKTKAKIEPKMLLSMLWTFLVVNYIYCDVFTHTNPEDLKMILNGGSGDIRITPIFLLYFAVVMELPMLMIILTRVLPVIINKWMNIIIALVMILILKKSTCFAGGQFLNGFACKNSLISFSLINGSVETSFKAPFGG